MLDIGYEFKNKELLFTALTCNKPKDPKGRKLELLGDLVIDLFVEQLKARNHNNKQLEEVLNGLKSNQSLKEFIKNLPSYYRLNELSSKYKI